MNFSDKVNSMTLGFADKLSFISRLINIGAQIIDSTYIQTYAIVSARFINPDS